MLKNLKVLYVEKEKHIREHITEALEFMSMNVISISNGVEAYNQYLKFKPDILISDIEILISDNITLVEEIRHNNNDIQIIVTTRNTETEYFLKALELNLVKYLLHPISLVNIKDALIISNENIENRRKDFIKYFNKNDFYNLIQRHLVVNKTTVRLDNHERDFLELLLSFDTEIVTYSKIEEKVWNKNMTNAAVRSLVRNLRRKLPPSTIENISKIGYRINIQSKNTC